MTVTTAFAGAAQGNGVQNRHIVLYHGGFAYDDTRCMIKHYAATNARCRVNIDP